ncbi:hypothetical protein ACFOY4_01585 [Actinomadura syzygii]|uniref:Uncharacterized protein n=1 Tax=Actinomadura syzygii TaxID=1427538 RepID=A0A5D0TTA0_9ACTN|nr:hypothetical protein [Actinomadura syzygii]TYC08562.1 hypothetical protein FXF65_37340 [Actinomadura syzygii]
MSIVDPRAWFPDFYTNPVIAMLSEVPRWTISGCLADDLGDPGGPKSTRKAPIDMRQLLDGADPSGRRLRGAWSLDDLCLVTLEELTERMPNAANVAYYLRAQTDGVLVIDIEPDCPAELSAELLALPEVVYAELSMSGRGFHVIAPIPANFRDLPVAAGKRVLREEHGWYEILLDHWVTFTRRPVPEGVPTVAPGLASAPAEQRLTSVAEVYAALAEKARACAAVASTIRTTLEVPDIAMAERIVKQTITVVEPRLKTIEDFHGDTSRWEFSVLNALYREMLGHLAQHINFGLSYSASDKAWLLYQAAVQVLPARPKHNERRNGRQYLLDRAAAMIAGRQPHADRT